MKIGDKITINRKLSKSYESIHTKDTIHMRHVAVPCSSREVFVVGIRYKKELYIKYIKQFGKTFNRNTFTGQIKTLMVTDSIYKNAFPVPFEGYFVEPLRIEMKK